MSKVTVTLVIGGWDYVSLAPEEEDYVNTLLSVSPDARVIQADSDPYLAAEMGVTVVPSIIRKEGEIVSYLLGVCSKEQIESFIETGVSPI